MCVGCNRSLYEVAAWSRLTDEQRSYIMNTLNDPERHTNGKSYKPERKRSSRARRTP